MKDGHLVPIRLLNVKREGWVDLVETRLVSLDSELEWSNAKGNRLHGCFLTIVTEEQIVDELREDALVGPR